MQKVVVLKPNQSKIIELILDKPNQDQELYVFFVAKNNESFTLSTFAKHLKPNTISLTVVRGVLFNQAKAKIEGMVEIGEKISGCEAFLDQKILLVGDKARADVSPQLEIRNNDVKASHSASVGRVDEEQLFYLMSRGLSQKQATNELVKGFFKDIFNKIKNPKAIIKLKNELIE